MEKVQAVVATALIADAHGRVLLLERSEKNATQPATWQAPEGKIKFGEDCEQALRRELEEELGCQIATLALAGAQSMTLPAKGKLYHTTRVIYRVTLAENNLRLSEDHTQYRWLSPTEALSLPLFPGTDRVIRLLAKE
jgi:8-oxo-dGTP diphosphatase